MHSHRISMYISLPIKMYSIYPEYFAGRCNISPELIYRQCCMVLYFQVLYHMEPKLSSLISFRSWLLLVINSNAEYCSPRLLRAIVVVCFVVILGFIFVNFLFFVCDISMDTNFNKTYHHCI